MTGETPQLVHIIDDDPSICDGLSNLFESVGIGAACYSSAEQFQDLAQFPRAGCILLDARLPGLSGPEFHDELVRSGSSMPVIFMTAHGDMPMVRKVLKAGALEFLIKPFQQGELLHAVQQAFTLEAEKREEKAVIESVRKKIADLTERERQVMAMVTAGLLNKQIAAELEISEIMVKVHRRRVMDGMRADSLADLVKMCERVKFASWVANS